MPASKKESMDINITPLSSAPVSTLPREMVERKGLGHPDTMCDAIMEHLSGALCRAYLDRFGAILHHNVDKGLLWAGAAETAFGGGEVQEPIEIYLTGRATAQFRGVNVPVDEIAIESSRAWLREHLRYLDPERHVRLIPRLRSTSSELTALFLRQQEAGTPLANDTSLGVGFAPFDTLERIVLAVERRLNHPDTKRRVPASGEDVKVMGARYGNAIELTVACAMVDRHVRDLDDYFVQKSHVHDAALAAARELTDTPITVAVNAADGDTPESIYLTVTGLSAESGDDGEVGRGNRANGLITPYRPMTLEAVAGKNPVNHVGKLYNLMANRIAQAVVEKVDGVLEAYCFLQSRIGSPITEPQVFEVQARAADPGALDTLTGDIEAVARETFASVDRIWQDAVEGRLQVW